MRCLVTGASGFLGSHLVRKLLQDNHCVTVFLRPSSDTWRLTDCLPGVRVLHGTMEEMSELAFGLQKEMVDVVFHLAWAGVAGEYRNSTEPAIRNLSGSLNLWETVHAAGCKTFIGVGTQAEYGPCSTALHEDFPLHPQTVYGASKMALATLVKQLCVAAGMRFAWLRLFSAYGPADNECHMVPSLIRALQRREKPALTAGEQVWDYLHVEDAARALCAVMECKAEGVFNLGSGKTCILRDFILGVRDCIDPTLPLGFSEVPYRPDQVMHLEAKIDRLQNATGWLPRIKLAEGIRRTVEWYQKESVQERARIQDLPSTLPPHIRGK